MGWMLLVTYLARIVLVLLIAMSIYAVAIILERRRFFKENSIFSLKEKLFGYLANKNLNEVEKLLSTNQKNLFCSQIVEVMKSKKLSVESAIILSQRKNRFLEEGKLSTLGTFGATAPFIGLLGTVFGIIVAFGELSQGKVDSNSIMYALAEALILTAVGLIVAIPSVIFFNHYNRLLKETRGEVNSVFEVLKDFEKKEN